MRNCWCISLVCAAALSLQAAPSPQEALKQMRVPDGFAVTLVASEPQIRQPLSVSFDARGRMWVLQYLQYPNPAGLKAVSVDQYLRTKYDRVPEPPPRGPKGADRITICEDANGDGRPDTFKDFLSDLNLASGFALGHGGVFVVQPPYLLFYADKNGDDVPDGAPEVLLSGFGLEDSHALANSLTWGPDGWLYGAHGSTVTAKIRGIEFQQGIWRYHPITREFELFAEGGGNTWGMDFDDEGEVIAGTNFGDVIGLHQVQGGYYVKGFAKHGPLHNPHTYGYLEHMPYSGWKGGRVICGGVIYHGDLFPQQFEGAYVAANLLRRSIDWHFLERNGSTFKGRYGGSFIETDDPTFRPVDCTVGPDGAVYVSDWCDPRASHVDPVDNWEKDTGRIYRIGKAGGEKGKAEPFDLTKLSNDELVNLLSHRNDWFRREARNQLATRRDTSVLSRLRAQSLQTTNASLALQSLWALQVSGGFDHALASKLLNHPHAPVRAWTIRLLADKKAITPELRSDIVSRARIEPSAMVRSQLACSAKRLPIEDSLLIIRELLHHGEDAGDAHIPLLAWWAIEDKVTVNTSEVLTLLSSAGDWQQLMMRQHIIERLARRFAAETNATGQQACVWMLRTAMTSEVRMAVLRGIDKAWEGQRKVSHDQALGDAFVRVWNTSKADAVTVRVGLRLSHPAARQEALNRLVNTQASDVERASLAETLGQCGTEAAIPTLVQLLDAKAKLQTAAISAL
ncbi:MAG TPA: PVC-type heme-binding CxxCH protein, partial [Candidatus Acidoferrum sp.]|nr:PVC-type heme-binding CxxCH protein [Candidatus Acidoferrum sp.]